MLGEPRAFGPVTTRPSPRRTAVLILALAAPCLAVAQQPQVPVPFRAEVVLVPVSVRVVEGDGRPVTGLESRDFEIFDKGVRQDIAHFSVRSALTNELVPRTFVFVLGRGHLTQAGAMQAVIDFVRSSLLPKDRVCVVAFQHATEPTIHHDAIVRLLQRYAERHEPIEGLLAQRGYPGSPSMPSDAAAQKAITDLFAVPGPPPIQPLPGSGGGRALEYGDFSALGRAIEYTRHIDGEKHLVFLADQIPLTGRTPDYFLRHAAAARTTVSLVQTGGLPTPGDLNRGRLDLSGSLAGDDALRANAAREAAAETGGWASFYRNADKALLWLARATSVEYLLGYYPTDPPRDGEYRPIEVKVRHRGATVLYRHGYEARPRLDEPLDVRRLFVEGRIRDVAARPAMPFDRAHPGPSPWAKIAATVDSNAAAGSASVIVDLAIDPRRITFMRIGQDYAIDIDLAVFVTNAGGKPVGEQWERLERTFDAVSYERLMKQRIQERVSVAVEARPAQVKVVFFEYGSDRSSSVTARVR